jgi:tRNA A58 N-methylase Trm61
MCFVCPSWLSFVLYNPLRKLLTDRRQILDESGINAGSVVLEIGAGNGFLTEALASSARRTIAVELQDGMVRKLKRRVPPRPGKIEIITGDISSASAGEDIADVCLLYYSFHEIGDKQGAVANIGKMLKKGGVLAIYEPSVEVAEREMLKTVSMFEKDGYVLEVVRNGLFTRFVRLRKTI